MVFHHQPSAMCITMMGRRHTPMACNASRESHTTHYPSNKKKQPTNYPHQRLPVTWLNTIWLNFFVESFGLKILSQVTTKLGKLHSNSRNKYVNSRKYHNVGHMRCMHAHPHCRKVQLPLRLLRDLRSR